MTLVVYFYIIFEGKKLVRRIKMAFIDEIKTVCSKGKTLVLYCERGNTSMLIAKKLMSYNIDAYSLYGGVNEYKKYLAYYKN